MYTFGSKTQCTVQNVLLRPTYIPFGFINVISSYSDHRNIFDHTSRRKYVGGRYMIQLYS
jgi:hypothetical protein